MSDNGGPLQCSKGDGSILGRAVLVLEDTDQSDWKMEEIDDPRVIVYQSEEGHFLLMHSICFEELFRSMFQAEQSFVGTLLVGDVKDFMAGFRGEVDEQSD